MRSKNKEPLAIVCADLHLSHRPPLARSGEKSWYAAMERSLLELGSLAKKLGHLSVLCAGDVFDKWNSPPELINFAIDTLPDPFLTIAGQHDLPYHDLNALDKSALGTLVKTEYVFIHTPFEIPNGAMVSGFGWEEEIKPPLKYPRTESYLSVALIHGYCYTDKLKHPDADPSQNAKAWAKQLQGYDVAIFGDNHTPFEIKIGNLLIYNCGGFYRRHSNETHDPSVGILYSDGTIERHYLDTTEDVFTPTSKPLQDERVYEEIQDFVQSLQGLDCDPFDFKAQLLLAAKQEPHKGVRKLLRELADDFY